MAIDHEGYWPEHQSVLGTTTLTTSVRWPRDQGMVPAAIPSRQCQGRMPCQRKP